MLKKDQARHLMVDEDWNKVLAWACWDVPLLVADVVIQVRAAFRSDARLSTAPSSIDKPA